MIRVCAGNALLGKEQKSRSITNEHTNLTRFGGSSMLWTTTHSFTILEEGRITEYRRAPLKKLDLELHKETTYLHLLLNLYFK